jgi:hypothetical protein
MDILILGGLPVTVEVSVCQPDRSVGETRSYVDEWVITHVNGRKCKKPPQWLYNRIDSRKDEEERILSSIYDNME